MWTCKSPHEFFPQIGGYHLNPLHHHPIATAPVMQTPDVQCHGGDEKGKYNGMMSTYEKWVCISPFCWLIDACYAEQNRHISISMLYREHYCTIVGEINKYAKWLRKGKQILPRCCNSDQSKKCTHYYYYFVKANVAFCQLLLCSNLFSKTVPKTM